MNVSASQPFELSLFFATGCSTARAGPRALNFKAFVRAVVLVLSQSRMQPAAKFVQREHPNALLSASLQHCRLAVPVPGSFVVRGQGLLTGEQENLMIPIYLSGVFFKF